MVASFVREEENRQKRKMDKKLRLLERGKDNGRAVLMLRRGGSAGENREQNVSDVCIHLKSAIVDGSSLLLKLN